MEAARVATERGHSVTIFEKTGELGGAILGCCVTPGKDKMKWYADWIRYQIADLNIDVKLCTTPSVKDLKTYDVVVNATGSLCGGTTTPLWIQSLIWPQSGER